MLLVDFVTYGAAFWRASGSACWRWRWRSQRAGDAGAAERIVRTRRRREACARPRAWRPGVATLAVVVLLLTVGTSLQTPMIGAYVNEVLDVQMSFMAMLLPIPAIVGGIFLWRFMRVSDRFGRHVVLAVGLLVAALSIFALTLTTSPFIAVNFVVIAGLGYAISMPAWGAAALDATDAGSRGLWLGSLAPCKASARQGGKRWAGSWAAMWGPLAPFKLAAFMLLMALALIVAHQYAHARKLRMASATAAIAG